MITKVKELLQFSKTRIVNAGYEKWIIDPEVKYRHVASRWYNDCVFCALSGMLGVEYETIRKDYKKYLGDLKFRKPDDIQKFLEEYTDDKWITRDFTLQNEQMKMFNERLDRIESGEKPKQEPYKTEPFSFLVFTISFFAHRTGHCIYMYEEKAESAEERKLHIVCSSHPHKDFVANFTECPIAAYLCKVDEEQKVINSLRHLIKTGNHL